MTRDTFGPGEQFAHRLIAKRAEAMGLETRPDHAANLFMTLRGEDRSAPCIMTGSHLDSVGNGGNFDGAAGVIAGLVAIRSLQQLGLRPHRDVTTVAFRAEESVWFQVSYIGSRSAFGVLPAGALGARRVDTGRTLEEHMAECGAHIGDVRAGKASLEAKSIKAFVELHIEQAPQLVEAGIAVAVGTGVPGNFRYPQVKIEGEYAHVGLPRRFRHDTVLAASEFALGLDEIWKKSDAAGRPMAFTIGRFHTDPKEHALTKVAGEMELSLDVRAYDKDHLAELEDAVRRLAKDIEQQAWGALRSRCTRIGRRGAFASRGGRQADAVRQAAGHPDHAAGEPCLPRHGHPHGCRRAIRHAVRAQRQRQSQPARGHGDR